MVASPAKHQAPPSRAVFLMTNTSINYMRGTTCERRCDEGAHVPRELTPPLPPPRWPGTMLARATSLGSGLSSVITLYILATAIPQPPVFQNQVRPLVRLHSRLEESSGFSPLQILYCNENVSVLGNVGAPMAAWDPNGSPLTFTIISQPVGGMFVPAASPQGQLIRGLSGTLDFFAAPLFNLSVVAMNGLSLPLNSTANITVQLLWVNQAPAVPSGQALSVKEGAALGAVVGQFNFSDRDTQAPIFDSVVISIVSQDATPSGDLAPFNVSAGGLLRVASGTGAPVARLDYATKSAYTVSIRAVDRFGAATFVSATVLLLPMNRAPVWPPGGVVEFFAASQVAQSVGPPLTTLVTDPNIAAGLPDTLSFVFANASQNLQGVFAIDRASGQITVVSPTATLFLSGMVYNLVRVCHARRTRLTVLEI